MVKSIMLPKCHCLDNLSVCHCLYPHPFPQVQRYVVADDRVLLMVEDGSLAWDVKDYIITQTDCTKVSFEQLSFDCAGWTEPAKKTEL